VTRLRIPLLLIGLAWRIAGCQISSAKELTQPAADAFARYVQLTEARMQRELSDPAQFLYIDSLAEAERNALQSRLLAGQVMIAPMVTRENGRKIPIPDGLVHHWLAVGFIPGATRDQAIALAQDYSRYAELYAPDVQRAEILSRQGQHFEVSYRFYRHAIVTVVYNARFAVEYFAPDPSRGYSFARSTRIAEVQNPAKNTEREFPVDNDHGYLWRLNLYTRYLERDNGVYIQIEFLALSRTVPPVFAWLVNPYLHSVPRDYLTHFIVSTGKALQPHPQPAARTAVLDAALFFPESLRVPTFQLSIASSTRWRWPGLSSSLVNGLLLTMSSWPFVNVEDESHFICRRIALVGRLHDCKWVSVRREQSLDNPCGGQRLLPVERASY
jgi:hypothetical protein